MIRTSSSRARQVGVWPVQPQTREEAPTLGRSFHVEVVGTYSAFAPRPSQVDLDEEIKKFTLVVLLAAVFARASGSGVVSMLIPAKA